MLNFFRLSRTEDVEGLLWSTLASGDGKSVPSSEAERRGCMSRNFLRSVSTGLRRVLGGAGYSGGVEPRNVMVEDERS